MQKPKIEIGEKVVVNQLHDATIYRIAEVSPDTRFMVRLEVKVQGIWRSAGWMDTCYLMVPTSSQLNAEATQA